MAALGAAARPEWLDAGAYLINRDAADGCQRTSGAETSSTSSLEAARG